MLKKGIFLTDLISNFSIILHFFLLKKKKNQLYCFIPNISSPFPLEQKRKAKVYRLPKNYSASQRVMENIGDQREWDSVDHKVEHLPVRFTL